MPRTYAGHNGYARFGIPPDSATPVVVLGLPRPQRGFLGCRPAATIDNGVELENEEQGGTVFVCLRPRGSWSQAWPRLAHPDA